MTFSSPEAGRTRRERAGMKDMKPLWDENGVSLFNGDCLAVLRTLPARSVNCCVTSPPYFGLRDYGTASWEGGSEDCDHRPPDDAGQTSKPTKGQREHAGRFAGQACWKCGATRADKQIGLEPTPADYVVKMVEVFREVRRVLKDDGTLWLNLGDSYNAYNGNRGPAAGVNKTCHEALPSLPGGYGLSVKSLKPKDLIGIPWAVAFALRDDGWYLRSDIIWAKSNCMPESVTDRPTKAHEYLFLLSKSQRYHYDHEAIKEPAIYDIDGTGTAACKARQAEDAKSAPTALRAGIRPAGLKDARNLNGKNGEKERGHTRPHEGFNSRWDLMDKHEQCTGMRNKRDVWTIAPAQFAQAHFATFPPKLIEPCIRAGVPDGGTCLDPFFGAGTTGLVCQQQHVRCVGIELNPAYCDIAIKRLAQGVLFGAGSLPLRAIE